jgi:hypothetical protein
VHFDLSHRSATASFRLDENALSALQEDAKEQNISVNALLNQIVLEYSNFTRPMRRFRMILIPASTFRYFLEATTDEAIIKVAQSAGSNVPKTYMLAKWGASTMEYCLEFLKTMSAHAKQYDYSESVHGGTLSVTLSHHFGAKGSIYLQHYVQAMLEPLGKLARFTADDNAVVFEVT